MVLKKDSGSKNRVKVMVALEDRFFRTRNGNIYSKTTCDYNFWSRYLKVFDEVIVLARVRELDKESLDKPKANGHNVSFWELPYYVGPFQYLKKHYKLNKAIKQSVEKADAFILRIPGTISTRLWYYLKELGKPYGVEVIGDSLDSMNTAGANKLLQSMLSRIASRNQKKQCRDAVVAAYVSEFYLQQKYPPGGWSTHYSTIGLLGDAIIEESKLEQKIVSFKDVAEENRPLRICHAGTMEVAYKAQDILLEAVCICRDNGLAIELVLLGEGRLAAYYKSRVEQLGLDKCVKFLGMLPAGDEVRKQLDIADMFLLPSTTEGLPRILIEAMARGLPCIATNVGGIPELLDNKDMVPPGNANKLASQIVSVASDFKRMKEMSYRNFKMAKNYSMHKLNPRRIEFYHKLVDETLRTRV